jgi:hypothetical protein
MAAFGRIASCLRVHNVARDIMSIRVGMKRGFCEGNHERLVRMPSVMNAKVRDTVASLIMILTTYLISDDDH